MKDELTTLEAANIVDHMYIHLETFKNISKLLNGEISLSGLHKMHKQTSLSVSSRTSRILQNGYERFLEEYNVTERTLKEYEEQLSGEFKDDNGFVSKNSPKKIGGSLHELNVGSTYLIQYREVKEDRRSCVTVVANYPNFYLVKTDKGVVTTILKNDLCTDKYEIKKSHNGGAVAGSTN
ncbi:hypothetical protein [Aedoeadaptatus coxii]|uniref:hypothetical protein n=1 Tax=Aedoeadaptatus coxii TaxID=755172 RepID=UPI002AD21124|nr:hypothetical protein [Peptoniphilus coxii]